MKEVAQMTTFGQEEQQRRGRETREGESGPFRSARGLQATDVVLHVGTQNSRVNSAPHTVPRAQCWAERIFCNKQFEAGRRRSKNLK